jgi:hypothetical protein
MFPPSPPCLDHLGDPHTVDAVSLGGCGSLVLPWVRTLPEPGSSRRANYGRMGATSEAHIVTAVMALHLVSAHGGAAAESPAHRSAFGASSRKIWRQPEGRPEVVLTS